jgi:hypothetical protein
MLSEQLNESYERLLASGCDRRLIPGDDHLNAYGASVLPRDTMALGSCSCSSPSRDATAAAYKALQELRDSSDPRQTATRLLSDVRAVIRNSFQLPSDTGIALTPSGTDVELLALALVRGSDDGEIVNVLVGPDEAGRGTIKAAAGRHYDNCQPRGFLGLQGQPVNEKLASQVTVASVNVRDGRGEMLPLWEIDAAVTETVINAVSRGARVLVHLIAHSKTGIHAPSLTLTDRLANELKESVAVIVDAAQGRLAPAAYRAAVDRGYLVSVTGSKFFGGPPFAGALLVPPSLHPATSGLDRLPVGFENYFSREELPESWATIRARCDDWLNVGSLLRWVAAKTEIETYFRIDPATRQAVAEAFANTVESCFADTPCVSTLPSFQAFDPNACFDSIEPTPTVYAIEITSPHGNRWDESRLNQLHRQLNRNDAAGFHLGRPVVIGRDRCVLRIALGAPLIVEVANNRQLGRRLSHRIDWMTQRLARLSELIGAATAVDTIEKAGR